MLHSTGHLDYPLRRREGLDWSDRADGGGWDSRVERNRRDYMSVHVFVYVHVCACFGRHVQ